MKVFIKKHLLILPLALIATALCVLCLACGSDVQREDLAAPANLRIVDEVLQWDKVENARGYVVDISGKEYKTETNSIDIFMLTSLPSEYSLRVKAYGDKNTQNDSTWSDAVGYETFIPDGLKTALINNGTEIEIVSADKTKVRGKVTILPTYDGKPVTSIRQRAFSECNLMTSIIIPNSITTIGSEAFYRCKNLKQVRLSQSLERLNNGVFYECSSLTEITIPNSIKEICNIAFICCTSLESVVIPDSVKKIGISVFESCDNLKSITVDEGNAVYKSDGNCIIKIDNNELVEGCGVSVIPDYVKSIGEHAFYRCLSLTEITIPGNVEIIKADAFGNCKALKSITLEEGIKAINSYESRPAFGYCTALTEIYIPASIEYIYSSSFEGCVNLNFTVAEDNEVYKSDGGCLIKKSGNVLVRAGSNYVIPDYIEVIGKGAFAVGNKDFFITMAPDLISDVKHSVVIPEGVHTIQADAFMGNDNIDSVFLPSTLEKIGTDAFKGCGALRSVTIPANVTKIEIYAFSETTVYMPFKEIPLDWYRKNVYDSFASNASVISGCDIRYDDGLPYVYSVDYNAQDTVSCSFAYLPTRKGYTFEGWTTEEGSTDVEYENILHSGSRYVTLPNPILSSSPLAQYKKPPNGLLLYAVWKPVE
ncbi:MAG: leucine-rich repeat protein [Clostridiales bacterium]|nr:leucine-rich repeat protein [Clostridiales bacterium]